MLYKAICTTTAVFVAVHHTFSQRYDVIFMSTNNSTYLWKQNIEKPEVTFEVKWCSGNIAVVLQKGRNLFLYQFVRSSSVSDVRVKVYKKEIQWEIKDLVNIQLDCQPYKRFKVTWIEEEIVLWHILGLTWQKILSWRDPDQNIAKQISTVRLRSTSQANWRVYYSDHTAIRKREICIKF